MRKERVAVVGSGVAGLTAAYLLQQHYDVTLFESEDRLGGHTHTHDVVTPDEGTVPIDTGFIVHNRNTYPLLCRLFEELDIETRPTEMSMSIHCDDCGLEFAGAKGLRGVFSQPSSLVNVKFLLLLLQVPKFFRQAREMVEQGNDDATLGEFLSEGRYSEYFTNHFVLPIVSCVWSMAPGSALQYPARYLFTFLQNHGMLRIGGSPAWRTVVGGSRTYVDAIAKTLTSVATSTPVRAIVEDATGVTITTDDDQGVHFDRAVIATHADTTLALLSRPTELQTSLLGTFQYSLNDVCLHTDTSLLAHNKKSQAAWNFSMSSCEGGEEHAVVSYDMNRLQGVTSRQQHVVTLNEGEHVDPDLIVDQMRYTHPIYSPATLHAQERLPELNGPRLAFAGAYQGWGFHEDGCRSGVEAARALGVSW